MFFSMKFHLKIEIVKWPFILEKEINEFCWKYSSSFRRFCWSIYWFHIALSYALSIIATAKESKSLWLVLLLLICPFRLESIDNRTAADECRFLYTQCLNHYKKAFLLLYRLVCISYMLITLTHKELSLFSSSEYDLNVWNMWTGVS